MCMDKGYDFPDIRELVEEYGYTAHIRSRGEENNEKKGSEKDILMAESFQETAYQMGEKA